MPLRTPSRISDSLHQRLNAYALAASAAGVSLLALAQPAHGRIVYHRAHHRFYFGFISYSFDVNHDGIADFVFNSQFAIAVAYFSIQPAASRTGNRIWGYKTTDYGNRFASALRAGVKVDASKKLGGGSNLMTLCSFGTGTGSTQCFGQWGDVRNRYLGLKFYDVEGKAHFGWARLNTGLNAKGSSSKPFATLTGYAYETIPNKPIITGKTKGPDVVTVRDASLGHLARGASAMKAWRVRESK
jgi:hypothetical protein